MKFVGFIFFFVLATITAHAQEDWRKIFPNAEAVFTNRTCDVTIKKENDKWIATSDFSEDLVYLTDNSVKQMSRGHIYHSGFNQLKKWDAYIQLPDDKKKWKVSNAKTSSSTQDYIFYDDVKSTSFDYTGGAVGATRHLEYQLHHTDVHLLSPYYFERYFPVGESELRIIFPSDVKIKYVARGLNADKIVFSESKKKGQTIYTFHISKLNGVQPYPDAPDDAYYSTQLIFYIDKVLENGEWKNFLSTTEDIYRYNYAFIRDLNKNRSTELEKITDSLVKKASNDLEKTKKIYQWVQSNIKYVAFEEGLEGFIPREASLVCNRRFGDCKDMASLLTSMLTYVNIPAYITWIGTRDIPYDYTELPLPIVDNHMICAVKFNNDYLFLDATDNACLFGYPSTGIQGKQALVSIGENEFKIVRVPVVSKEKNILLDSTFLELTDKGVIGKIKIELRGYWASGIRSALNYKNKEEQEDYFKDRFARASNKIKFSNWAVQEKLSEEKIIVTADFDLPDYAKKLGDEWFLNLNLFKWYEHQEIDFPKRTMPIEFSFLEQSFYVTTLKIPSGYGASYVPKSNSFKNDVWGFTMNYATTKDAITLSQQFDTDHLMLYPEQFERWNKILEHLFPNYKQTVSIRKN
jgi:transglutaminase-like putative cysteine protease